MIRVIILDFWKQESIMFYEGRSLAHKTYEGGVYKAG